MFPPKTSGFTFSRYRSGGCFCVFGLCFCIRLLGWCGVVGAGDEQHAK